MVVDGFDSPYVKVFYKDKDLSAFVERFMYTYDEIDDDECTLAVKLSDRSMIDLPEYQEEARLKITWGYMGDKKRSKVRIVYIRNASATFEKEGVMLTLECTEKATSMKNATEKTVYKNKGLLGVVADKAAKHGLTAKVQLPENTLQMGSFPGETTKDFILRWQVAKNTMETKKLAQEQAADPKKWIVTLDSVTKQYQANRDKKYAIPLHLDPNRPQNGPIILDKTQKALADHFEGSGDFHLPQANKSDIQFVKAIADRTKGGQTIVETRDDDILIRKRNFKQKPYKTYEYGGTEGELIAFQPETLNRPKKGSSSQLNFSGWDGVNGTFFSGETDASNPDNNPSIAKAQDMIAFYKEKEAAGGGQTIFGKNRPRVFENSNIPLGRQFMKIPVDKLSNQPNNTGRKQGPYVLETPITLTDHIKALEKAVQQAKDNISKKEKDYYNSIGYDPQAAFDAASNKRQGNQLKRNPAVLQIYGDPYIETGILVTVLGAAKKHSGNYYVPRSVHSIDKGSGYTTEMECVKQGHNIISNPEYVNSEALGKKVNKEKGDRIGSYHPKSIKIHRHGF